MEDKCKCKDCRALENEIIMLGSILEWIGEIIKGNKVSDFALSFPLVRQVYDRLGEG